MLYKDELQMQETLQIPGMQGMPKLQKAKGEEIR